MGYKRIKVGAMVGCNACNKVFQDENEQKLHYKSEWHRFNLKRKIKGLPGVTESLFLERQSALAEAGKKLDEAPMLYTCGICDKGYKSSKAHEQHLSSKSHLLRALQGVSDQEGGSTIIKPLPKRVVNKPSQDKEPETEESEESEWEEVDPDEDLVDEARDSLSQLKVDEHSPLEEDVDGDDEFDVELDPSCCFMCDLQHATIESCMVHMHKRHGFFIPDIEYLKDPKGFLTYLGLKVKKDFICLYCNERCHAFSSLEGVRKHMDAKSHCKVRFGDGGDDEEAELEEFYDYSSSYEDAQGKQLVLANDLQNSVELTNGGSELILTRREKKRVSTRILGSREFLRYYRQKPRPTPENMALTAVLAARYRSMGLATVQTREHMVRLKVLKNMNKYGVENMRSKFGMKSNVIRNLPNNVTY